MQHDGMILNNVYVSLTVHRSGHKINGSELVVTCGYSVGGQYGYFICLEDQTKEKETNIPVYKYTNQYIFFPKKDESSFAQALQYLKSIVNQ